MTISNKTHTAVSLKTLLNLSTSKRSLMLLWNPEEIHREFWFVHISVFGLSLVYFSLTTETDSYGSYEYWDDDDAAAEEYGRLVSLGSSEVTV